MRPPNEAARRQLRDVLRRGRMSTSGLAERIGVSVRTALRLLAEAGETVVSAGPPTRRRHALRRPLRGDSRAQPVFVIGEDGQATPAGQFSLTEPQGSWFDARSIGWPVDAEARDGWWDGLPYPLYDMAPQGYLGRLFAQRESTALEVAPDPRAWSDDDIAWILSRRGVDLPGNLIIGEPALRLWQSQRIAAAPPVSASDVAQAYPQMADDVVHAGTAGSSAAGEFPKFLARREHEGARTPHVIVKFSGRVDSRATERWSDLLVCEHLALSTLSATLPVAATRILQHGGRTFLESERFDRHGPFGRSPVVGLGSLSAHLLGLSTTDWRDHALALARRGLLDDASAAAIGAQWWFGRLIGNTDMHPGNLGLIPRDGRYTVAPAYDMLPMAWAPLPGGEIAPGHWTPALPLPDEAALWHRMCTQAIGFWTTASNDPRISGVFRSLCADNATRLADLAAKV